MRQSLRYVIAKNTSNYMLSEYGRLFRAFHKEGIHLNNIRCFSFIESTIVPIYKGKYDVTEKLLGISILNYAMSLSNKIILLHTDSSVYVMKTNRKDVSIDSLVDDLSKTYCNKNYLIENISITDNKNHMIDVVSCIMRKLGINNVPKIIKEIRQLKGAGLIIA